MKRTVLAIGLLFTFTFLGFAQERVTFNGNAYSIDWREEFDDKWNLKVLCLDQPCSPDTSKWYNKVWPLKSTDKEDIRWNCGSTNPKSTLTRTCGGYGKEYFVEDGIVTITSTSRRVKQDGSSTAYDFYDSYGMFNTPPVVGAGSYIEVRFKTSKRQGYNFTIYANTPHLFSQGKEPMSLTSKGYMMQAIDFMEMTTGSHCPKNSVLLHGKKTLANKDTNQRYGDRPGSMFCTKNRNYDSPFKISGDNWFEEWHIFQAIVEDTYFEAWLDGKKYCYDSWEKAGTLPEQCMELVFGNDQRGYCENAMSPIQYNGEEPYCVTSYIDYVRIGQKVK